VDRELPLTRERWVRKRLKLIHGLGLTRSRKTNHGWWRGAGCWRTGWDVWGNYPGSGHEHQRFVTLKSIIECFQLEHFGYGIPDEKAPRR
jgi:hypothetical protein